MVRDTDKPALQNFVTETTAEGATVYTDDAAAYKGMPFDHATVRHSVGEYVDGMAHTNGIESFWSMLKRAHKGVYHKISAKHLQRYVNEFSGRHNVRDLDTIDQMAGVAAGAGGSEAHVQAPNLLEVGSPPRGGQDTRTESGATDTPVRARLEGAISEKPKVLNPRSLRRRKIDYYM